MKTQTSNISAHEAVTQAVTISKPLQLVGVVMLGAVIMYGVGFLNTGAVHNATHDARHSQGFPCH